MSRPRTPGRGWAYAGALLGGVVSISANVAHSYVAPAGVPAGWRPDVGAVAGAVFWPLALFVAIEIWSRVQWPRGWRFRFLRWAGLLPVIGLAALVSYRHLSGLLQHYGEEPLVAYLGPLAIDGLMVMATGALIATGTRRTAQTATASAPAPPAAVTAPRPASQVKPSTPAKARAPRKPTKARRPVAETKKLIADAKTADPTPTHEEIAAKLGITDRRVRQVLKEAEPATAAANGASAGVLP